MTDKDETGAWRPVEFAETDTPGAGDQGRVDCEEPRGQEETISAVDESDWCEFIPSGFEAVVCTDSQSWTSSSRSSQASVEVGAGNGGGGGDVDAHLWQQWQATMSSTSASKAHESNEVAGSGNEEKAGSGDREAAMNADGDGLWSAWVHGDRSASATSISELEKLEHDLFEDDEEVEEERERYRNSLQLPEKEMASIREKEEEEKRNRRRFLTAEELLSTEREYSNHLNAVVELYLEPLQEAGKRRKRSLSAAARILKAATSRSASPSVPDKKAGQGADSSASRPTPAAGQAGMRPAAENANAGASASRTAATSPSPMRPLGGSLAGGPTERQRADSVGSKVIDLSLVECIFCTQELLMIKKLSEEMFLALATKIRDWTPEQTVGDVFLRLFIHLTSAQGDFLKLYAKYNQNYEAAIEAFTKEYDSNAAFKAFVDAADTDQRSEGILRLKNCLIMPVQRLPRYALLLAALLKYTAPDFSLLSDALEKVQDVLTQVDESVTEEERRKKLLAVQSKLGKKVKLLEPHRRYLHDSLLFCANSTPSKLHCYLFNDIFVSARCTKLLGQEYQEFQRRIPLVTAWIVADASNDPRLMGSYYGQCAFLLLSPQICYVFKCSSEGERSQWASAIATAIENLLMLKPANMELRRQYRPQWKSGTWRVIKRTDLTHRGSIYTTREPTISRVASADARDARAAQSKHEAAGPASDEAGPKSQRIKKRFNQLAERIVRLPDSNSSARYVAPTAVPGGRAAGSLYSPLGPPPSLPPRAPPDADQRTTTTVVRKGPARSASPGSGPNPKPLPDDGPSHLQ